MVALTEMFQAISLTLDMGRKLDFDHRFDRLGLDATMASLTDMVECRAGYGTGYYRVDPKVDSAGQ